MDRLTFQRQHATGRVLNVGCGDDPAGFGAGAVHLDIDWWDLPNFVQGDCRALPFPDGSFDTAVLGDVLEHCTDPEQAVREASRVAKRVVITVPEELALPSVGTHVALGLKQRADQYRRTESHPEGASDEEVIVAHKRTDPRFLKAYPESEVPHDGHINRFDEAWIRRLIAASGKSVKEFRKEPELSWSNWLIVLE